MGVDRRDSAGAPSVAFLSLCMVLVWLAAGLFGRDPWKPDEAYTVGVVLHIAQTGQWVVPVLAGEPFMEKPPLFFVTAAAFSKVLRDAMPLHEAARFATVFYVVLTVSFVYATARRSYGADAAWRALLILVGCIGYLQPAHLLVTDNSLVAGVAMAIYGLTMAPERPAVAGLLAGTGAGIAFLSKGLIGPGFVGVTAALLSLAPQWRKAEYVRTLLIAGFALAPWAIIWPWLLYRESPALFHDWLVLNNFGRYIGSARLGPETDHWMFVKVLPWFALPALPLAVWNLWDTWRSRARAWQSPGVLVPLVAACVIFAVLSSARNQRYLYGVPMLVPLALLASLAPPARWLALTVQRLGLALCVLGAAILWSGWLMLLNRSPAAIADRLLAQRPGFEPAIDPLVLFLAFVLTVAAAWTLRARIGSSKWIVVWGTAVTLNWALFTTLWLPYLEYGNSYRALVSELAAHVPPGVNCLANHNLGEPQRAMLEYFAGIVTYRDDTTRGKDCELVLVQVSRRRVFTLDANEWQPVWNGSRPGDRHERLWLFQRRRAGAS